MEKVYATLIIAKRKKLSQVPEIILEKVKDELASRLARGVITKEQYDEAMAN